MASKTIRKKYTVELLTAFLLFLLLLQFIPYITPNTMPEDCIFCKIIHGKVQDTKIEMETDDFVVFADIKPASQHHFLAVSKRHVDSLKSLTANDQNLISNMENGLRKVFQDKGIDANDALFGFHMPPFISVKHLHMHGIAPKSSMSFFHRFMFRPGSVWFKTVNDAQRYISEKVQ